MQESVIYQDIFQKGLQPGEATLILRQLKRRFGDVDAQIERKIQNLTTTQLEALA